MTDPRAAFEASMRERGWEDYELKREKDGYGDHDARLAWSVWQAAIKHEREEIGRLRELASTCYAGLGGECNLPETWIDALLAASNGEPFTTDGLLPFVYAPPPVDGS